MLFLEFLIFLFALSAIFLALRLSFFFRGGSLMSPFVAFAVGGFLLLLSRVFLLLSDSGAYELEDVTLHAWWHLIAALAFAAIILGTKELSNIARNTDTRPDSYFGMYTYLAVCMGVSAFVFYVAQPLEPMLSSMLVGSFFDRLGIHHFTIVLLGLFASWYYVQSTGSSSEWGRILRVSTYPFAVFLALTGAQHFWELLTESLKVITLSGEIIELVEQCILVPAYAACAFGFYRIFAFLLKTSRSAAGTSVM